MILLVLFLMQLLTLIFGAVVDTDVDVAVDTAVDVAVDAYVLVAGTTVHNVLVLFLMLFTSKSLTLLIKVPINK